MKNKQTHTLLPKKTNIIFLCVVVVGLVGVGVCMYVCDLFCVLCVCVFVFFIELYYIYCYIIVCCKIKKYNKKIQ